MPIFIRCFCVLAYLLPLACCSKDGGLEDLKRSLASLPPRATPVQVIKYLDNQKIEHSEYLKSTIEGNVIRAIIWVRRRGVIQEAYSMRFQFDQNDFMITYELNREYTGP